MLVRNSFSLPDHGRRLLVPIDAKSFEVKLKLWYPSQNVDITYFIEAES